MIIEALEALPALTPLDTFALEGKIPQSASKPSSRWLRKQALLPRFKEWLDQDAFADIALSWNQEGLFLAAFVDKPFEQAFYPKFTEGDALEVFIDTRDSKESRFLGAFCHRFVFLPAEVQEVSAQEITRFRSEDTHPLCDASDLTVQTTYGRADYEMVIEIPARCLHGFDPSLFPRVGFSYRLHRFKGKPQLFSSSTEHFSLEQQPLFWASFTFSKE